MQTMPACVESRALQQAAHALAIRLFFVFALEAVEVTR